jgi:uncharacterized protein YhdP
MSTNELVIAVYAVLFVLVVLFLRHENARHQVAAAKARAHNAEVAAETLAWEQAHPDLVAQGCPAPPTPKSMTYFRWGDETLP